MPRRIIADTKEAGNATDVVMFTMPANEEGFLDNVLAFNSTGGVLTLTLKVKRSDGNTRTLYSVDSIAAAGTNSYASNATKRLTPLTLVAGEQFIANASGAGVQVTIGGLRFTI